MAEDIAAEVEAEEEDAEYDRRQEARDWAESALTFMVVKDENL